MKKYIHCLFALALILSFSACENNTLDEIDDVEMTDDNDDWGNDWEDDDNDWAECFDFVYPITFIMPNGSTITGNNEEELDVAIEAWYEDHPDFVAEPTLQFPVQLAFDDIDELVTVNNEDELEEFEEDCEGDDDEWEECFDFVYPITFVMPNGSTITGNNEEELDAAIENWYDNHPDFVAEPTLQFPIQITYEDQDQPVTINDEEELESAYEDCD